MRIAEANLTGNCCLALYYAHVGAHDTRGPPSLCSGGPPRFARR